jgi:hypothetical protein
MKIKRYGERSLFGVFLFLSHANTGYSNTVAPTFFFTVPSLAFALLPIILIEGYFLKYCLPLRSYWVKVLAAGSANIVSTIVGMPGSWFLYTWGTPKLFKFLNGLVAPNEHWNYFVGVFSKYADAFYSEGMVLSQTLSVTMVAMVMGFLSSIIVEYLCYWALLKISKTKVVYKQLAKAVVIGNAVTYVILTIGMVLVFWIDRVG